ncbi:MAG: CPBP family intramembrane metalloprotease [Phycisphaerales bacterium]|nr:MAG: CPBP family intramembrane metalloprotease [Phycisphaerales bacterium]
MSLRQVDTALYVVGTVVCLAALATLWVRGRDPLRGAFIRLHRLDWAAVVFVILAYVAAASIAGGVAGGLLEEEADEGLAEDIILACINAASFGAAGAACLWLAWRRFRARWRGFGLTLRRFGPDLAWAVLTTLALWPVAAGLLWLSERAVRYWPGEEYLQDHRVIGSLENPALPDWAAVLLIITAVAVAPAAEEFFFRGVLQTKLKSTLKSRWAALALAGVCFGLVHSGQVAAIVPLMFMGMVLGFVYEATGSLIAPLLIHSLFNAKSLIWYYLSNAT